MDLKKQEIYLENAQKLVWKFINQNKWAIRLFDTREDMSQELLLKLWAVLPRYEPKRAKFSTFVFSVSKGLVCTKFKRENKAVNEPLEASEVPDNVFSEDDLIQGILDRECLKKAKSKLTRESALYYFGHKKQIKIASALSVTQETICKKIQRQTNKFKQEWYKT